MTSARAYFYDAATKQELSSHPANGMPFLASTQFEVSGYGKKVTAADFDRPVLVKRWFGPEMFDWVALRAGEAQ